MDSIYEKRGFMKYLADIAHLTNYFVDKDHGSF